MEVKLEQYHVLTQAREISLTPGLVLSGCRVLRSVQLCVSVIQKLQDSRLTLSESVFVLSVTSLVDSNGTFFFFLIFCPN